MSENNGRQCQACGSNVPLAAAFCPDCGKTLNSKRDPVSDDSTSLAATTSSATSLMSSPHVAQTMRSGAQIREYKIERLLGEGGMGGVFLARHTLTGQQVAIKLIRPEKMADREFRLRFIEEARIMSIMRHPNVVHLMDFFEEGGLFLMVMDYLDGGSVEKHLVGGPLPIPEAVRIACQVLRALAYGHALPSPVIHRDIKPENILLGPNGEVAVTDFGICRAEGRQQFTQTGCIVGTMEYMAPEVIAGEEAVAASDQYSLGITLYKLLTGQVPFKRRSNTGLECMQGHIKEPPPPPSSIRPEIPQALEAIVLKALAKNPADRFATCADMQHALEEFTLPARSALPYVPPPVTTPIPAPRPARGTDPRFATSEISNTAASAPEPRLRGLLPGLALGILVAVVAVSAWYFLLGPGRSDAPPQAPGAWAGTAPAASRPSAALSPQPPPASAAAPAVAPASLLAAPVAPQPAPAPPVPQAPICQPDCSGKSCGENGCGGSCGVCSGNYECSNGSCVRAAWWLQRRQGAESAAHGFFSAWNKRDPAGWERLLHNSYQSETHWGNSVERSSKSERIHGTRSLWKRLGWLSVNAREMKITMSEDGTSATVSFFQEYRSEKYNSDGNGSLDLIFENGQWFVVKENFTGIRKFL